MTAVTQLIRVMEVCVVDRGVLEQAIVLGVDDFEDGIQMACAIALGLEFIVTRDVNGFVKSPIIALSPEELRIMDSIKPRTVRAGLTIESLAG